MIQNDWIITKKTPAKGAPGFFDYTIVQVNRDMYAYWAELDGLVWNDNILSKRCLPIGTYTNDELTPLKTCYTGRHITTAKVVSTHIINTPKTNIKRLWVFGLNFGEYCFLLDDHDAPFKIKRGDHLVIQRELIQNIQNIEDYDDEDDDDNENGDIQYMPYTEKITPLDEAPLIRPLCNLTTKQKSPHFSRSEHINANNCDTVVVLGINSTDDSDNEIRKHILVDTEPEWIHFQPDEYIPEFQSEIGDILTIEHYYDENLGIHTSRILGNETVNAMRANLLNKHR